MTDNQDMSPNSSVSVREALADRYEIVAEIGTGGMGTVYKAFDIKLKRDLAIKVLHPDNVSDQHMIRLHREAQTICQLIHPNVVNIYDFMLHENEPVMVMEYVEGSSLFSIVSETGPLNLKRAVKVFRQICDAMEYAHQHGIMHRDLTPNNILVKGINTRRPEVKVVDFGVAKISTFDRKTITKSGFIVGTASVISPEQATGEETDARSDIYSMGCLMFFCMTGRYPFVGKTFLEIATKQVKEEAPELCEANSEIDYPEELEDLVARCLNKDPASRFQSMAELDEALDGLEDLIAVNKTLILKIEEEPVEQKPTGELLVLTVVLVVLASLAAFTWWIFAQERSGESGVSRSAYWPKVRELNDQQWLVLEGNLDRDDFQRIKDFPKIKRLRLKGTKFDEDFLEIIKDHDLEILDLRATEIGDRALETIAGMSGLRSLILGSCPFVNDRGMVYINRMPRLVVLDLESTQVTDDGIAKLTNLKDLELLYLPDSRKITDRSMAFIKAQKHLRSLSINNTGISEPSVRALFDNNDMIFIGLKNLDLDDEAIPDVLSPNLTMLDLSGNRFTDKTIEKLACLRRLWYLDVTNCPAITERGLSRINLEEENPRLRIVLTDKHPYLEERGFVDTEWYYEPSSYDLLRTNPKRLRQKVTEWQIPMN
ncbi:MAG: protein kinase [Candidatus Obscuribacterales bacterium]